MTLTRLIFAPRYFSDFFAVDLDSLVIQDADRLLDFDYTNEDIDSLRRQMTLPDQSGIRTNPASPSSDLLGSLGMASKARASLDHRMYH